MAAASSGSTNCQQHGHHHRDCTQPSRHKQQQEEGPRKKHWKKTNGQAGPKWCSLHNTTSHSDAECYKQQKDAHNKPQGRINFANIASAHSPQADYSGEEAIVATVRASSLVPTTNSSANPDKKIKSVIALGPAPKNMLKKQTDDSGLFVAVQETYAVEPATVVTKQHTGENNGSSTTVLVDSGSSQHYMDTDLHPGLRE